MHSRKFEQSMGSLLVGAALHFSGVRCCWVTLLFHLPIGNNGNRLHQCKVLQPLVHSSVPNAVQLAMYCDIFKHWSV
jgi:hypothetical protein